MNRQKHIILSYGFFLVWLLTFLYNGPLLHYAFNNSQLNTSILALTYILIPGIISIIISFNIKNDIDYKRLINISIIGCIIGSILLLYFHQYIPNLIIFIITGILGVLSVLFISGWGYLFTKTIKTRNMIVTMGLTIALGKSILSINQILNIYELYNIIIVLIFSSLLVSLYFSNKIENNFIKKNPVKYSFKPILILGLSMFFVNVSGGYILSLTFQQLDNDTSFFIIDILIYLSISIYLIIKKRLKNENNYATISLTILGTGLIILLSLGSNLLFVAYIFISFAYILIDILLWSIVGRIGTYTNNPYKVFFFVMGFNLISVFTGNIIFVLISDSNISILICAITVMISFVLIQLLYTNFYKMATEHIKINEYIVSIDTSTLTNRESEIVKLLCLNYKNKDIANQLFISENTLKTHTKNIYGKLGVHNKKELINLNNKLSK